jgi:MFS family permease
MRRLLLLVGALVFVDTMLYSALTPLLPHLASEFGLSKTRAGVLVGAYAAGALIGGGPGGAAAARLGPRRAVLAGLTAMGLASVGFAFARGFNGLFAARLLQGFGSAFTWSGAFAWLLAAAPRGRRGELLGAGIGAAVFGALFGPVVGVAAAVVGRGPVFAGLAGLAVVLAVATARLGSVPPERPTATALAQAFANRQFTGGLLLMALPAYLLGTIGVLAPLHLADAGMGAIAIGAIWLCSAALEAVEAPLVGRLSDRRGRGLPVRMALGAGVVVSLGLALGLRPLAYVPLVVLSALAFGSLFTPAFALIADGADASGLAQGVAFGLMSAAWAVGALAGPALGGTIASLSGDWTPFVVGAGLCALALFAVRHGHRAPAGRTALRAGLSGGPK